MAGLKTYHRVGCRKGHTERYVSVDKCVVCQIENSKRRAERHPERVAAEQIAYRERNREEAAARSKAWREEDRERHLQSQKACYQRHQQKNIETARRRYRENPARYKFYATMRKARIKQATLPGHYDELKRIYENCPEGHEVDHEVPLRGDHVCGLHVPWNLQYLTTEANRAKGNSFTPG